MYENDDRLRALIAENIAYYRKENGDTQAGLAEKLNYSDKSVSKWERGDGTPDVFILSKIAELYDITVQDLLREKKVPKARSKRILKHLLSVGLVWLVATFLYCVAQIFNILPDWAWLLFIYALPISGIVSVVLSCFWWDWLMQLLSSSLILWGAGLSIVLSFTVDSVSLLLLCCGVFQVLMILFSLLRYQSAQRIQKAKDKAKE